MTGNLTPLLDAAKAATANSEDSAEVVAKKFLKVACSTFEESEVGNDVDRLIKIGRSISDMLKSDSTDIEASLELLVTNCEMLAKGLQCPKTRFGKTGLMISRVTCGGMRFQQAWGPAIQSMDQVGRVEQNILDFSLLHVLIYANKVRRRMNRIFSHSLFSQSSSNRFPRSVKRM